MGAAYAPLLPHPSFRTAYEVGDMAQAIERSQMTAMRANFIQKCGRPDFGAMDVCHPDHITAYINKLGENYDVLRFIHQGLYLVSLVPAPDEQCPHTSRWTLGSG